MRKVTIKDSRISRLDHRQSVTRMKDVRDELERIGKKDSLTVEDELRFADLTEEFTQLDAHRKHLEREAVLSKARDALNNPFGKVELGAPGTGGSGNEYDIDPLAEPRSVESIKRGRNPWDVSDIRTYARDKSEVNQDFRSRAFDAVEKMPFATPAVREAATGILERFDDSDVRISKLVLAASSPEYVRAWSKVASGRGHLISPEEQRALTRAMSLTDSAGGYLVPFQLDPTVIIAANGSRNEIRNVARTVVATGDVWNGVSSGAVAWSWDAEAAQVSDDSTTFGQPSIPIYKAAGFVPISIEALEDEANVTAEVARLLAFGRDVLEASAFATGTGSSQPTGIVTALAAASPAVTVNSATTDTFASADVYALDSALPARYRGNASWLGNRSIFNRVRNFDANGGAQLWERIGADVPPQLLGRPVYEAEDMDGTVTADSDNYILIYGDFSNYVIADRIGMTVEFIPHLFQQTTAGTGTGRPTGQRGWYAYYRVGADSVNDGAFRMLNVT